MPKIARGRYKRICESIEMLRAACKLFDRIPPHERRADLNFLLSKYEHNPNEKQRKRDAKWT